MMIIGIDPGISGSICFFQDGIIKEVIEMPTMTDGKKNKRQVNGAQIYNEISERINKFDKKEIVDKAHDFGLVTLVDAAQSVPHMPVDVSSLNSDFFVFSGHKMLGPSGIGVLHAKQELLQNMDPFLYGGDMISSVSLRDAQWNDIPWKFEAGTPNIVGAIGLGKAIDYLNHLDMDNVRKHEQNLLSYALKKLNELGDIHVFGPKNPEITGGVLSFSYSDFHPHDIASILDTESIAIRAGHHCAQPLVEKLGVPATTRVSFYVYNDKSDIDKFVHGLEKVRSVLS